MLSRSPGSVHVNLISMSLSGKSVDFSKVVSMIDEMVSCSNRSKLGSAWPCQYQDTSVVCLQRTLDLISVDSVCQSFRSTDQLI